MRLSQERRKEEVSIITLGSKSCSFFLPLELTACDVWQLLLDKEIVEHIAEQTNLYARQTIENLLAKRDQSFPQYLEKWFATEADEIRIYIGIVLYMQTLV